VHAACTSGSQCEANGVAENPAANESFQAIGPGADNAALKAINGGTINGSGLTIDSSAGIDHYGAYVNTGGTITLIGSSTTITGVNGVRAQGGGSFAMTGGTITASEHAVDMRSDGNVTLSNVNIVDTSSPSPAVRFGFTPSNASFSMTGGAITSVVGAVHVAGDNNQATLSNVAINNANNLALWVVGGPNQASTLTINGGTSIVHTSPSSALLVGARGRLVIDDATVVATNNLALTTLGAAGALARVDAQNFSLQTAGVRAIQIDRYSVVSLTDGSITTTGNNAHGIWMVSNNQTDALTADRLTITTSGINAHALRGSDGTARVNNIRFTVNGSGAAGISSDSINPGMHALIHANGGTIDAHGAGGAGVRTVAGGEVHLDGVTVTATGANGRGLSFIGEAQNNTITLADSIVTTTGANAVVVGADGGDNQLNVSNATLLGDRLVAARARTVGNTTYDAKLNFNANNSILTGHAEVDANSTLRMNLSNGTDWTLTPSASGITRSDVTFLNLDASRVIFDAASTQRQTLVVGMGETGGNPAVYNAAGPNARIEMNTLLNAGGALANQTTDRLVINGNASGTTLITVNALTGSVGADTGSSASDGISLVQVSGNARADAFVLDGTYVTVGSQPWRYGLHAYGPGSANGSADNSQRLVDGSNPHWDWRLQSEFMDTFGDFKPVPQIANYLTAPTALFQSGLLDIAMLHRRLGDTRQMGTRPTDARHHKEFFLRTYGGDYDYRSNRSQNAYGYGADIRYTATQIGGTVHAGQSAHSSTRIGLAANYGQLRFAPRNEPDTRKTRMDTWSVSPTLNWQHDASGAYVDAMLAVGKFRADVATQLRPKTATLKGVRQTVSVETGLPLIIGSVTAVPQAQVVYQRLHFDRVWDVDGFDVSLGSPKQWTFKAGMEVRTTRFTAAGSAIRLYGKMHFAQNLNRHRQVWLGEAFALGKSGTVLENGAGVDAVLSKGRITLFADLTRQHRLSRRAGNQGWSANMGMKVRF